MNDLIRERILALSVSGLLSGERPRGGSSARVGEAFSSGIAETVLLQSVGAGLHIRDGPGVDGAAVVVSRSKATCLEFELGTVLKWSPPLCRSADDVSGPDTTVSSLIGANASFSSCDLVCFSTASSSSLFAPRLRKTPVAFPKIARRRIFAAYCISSFSTSGPSKSLAIHVWAPHGKRVIMLMSINVDIYATDSPESFGPANGADAVTAVITAVGISPVFPQPPAMRIPYRKRWGVQNR